MLRMFRAEFEGTFTPERLREDFIAALGERVRRGLLPVASQRRNRYAVIEESDNELRFRSVGFLTSLNIGWNDVRVRVESAAGGAPQIQYKVGYWAWAAYCVALCGVIGIVLIAAFLLFGSKLKGQQAGGEVIFWAMVIFWGFVWPWVLVAMHKRPAARALERLFARLNETGT